MIKIFNYEISKSGKQENLSNDQILKKVFLNQPINVFDIGANIGQSIERFQKIFSTQSKIYSFEPNTNSELFSNFLRHDSNSGTSLLRACILLLLSLVEDIFCK